MYQMKLTGPNERELLWIFSFRERLEFPAERLSDCQEWLFSMESAN